MTDTPPPSIFTAEGDPTWLNPPGRRRPRPRCRHRRDIRRRRHALAWLVAAWAPALVPISGNGRITSRVSPTLLDMAIAIALVPPLGVVGVTLHAGLFDDAFGAFLLFTTNFVSIILASVVVFLLTGFAPVRHMASHRKEIVNVLGTVVVGALLIMIPLGLTGASIISSATNQATAQQISEEWVDSYDDLSLGKVTEEGAEVFVRVSGSGALPDVDELEAALSETLGAPVSVVVEYFESTKLTSP